MALLIPKLRSHFAEFLNKGYLAHLRILSSSTCVGLRYGYLPGSLAAFLASVDSAASILVFCPHHTSALMGKRTSLLSQPRCLDGLYHQPALPILLCHCFSQTPSRQYRNINLLSIAYDSIVLGLGPDLPWEDEPSPGNLRLSLDGISTRLFVTYADIFASNSSTGAHAPTSTYNGTLLYHDPPINRRTIRSFGNMLSSVCFRRKIARPVSCYALFKGWLLLSQPPGCFSLPTSFPT